MGLLDDLKREGELARLAQQAEAERRVELERVYRDEIVPRLLGIYAYLSEMVEHLKLVDWIIEAAYQVPGLGKLGPFRQGNYRVFIDSHHRPGKISLYCDCTLAEERKFAVAPANAEEVRAFFTAHKAAFSEWPVRGGNGQITQINFRGRLQLPCGLFVEGDLENSRIRVTSFNIEELGSREYTFPHTAIDQDWSDRLGLYLLRKGNDLGLLPISEEARQRLRKRVEQEQAGLLSQSEPDWDPDPPKTLSGAGLLGGLRKKWLK